MTTSPVSVTPDTALADAARLLVALDLPSVRVVQSDAAAGMLRYRDALRGLRRARRDVHVGRAMIPDPDDPPGDPPSPSPAAAGDAPVTPEDRAPVPFEPDTLLPSQYFDRLRRSREYDPERRLLVAVLELGVNDYLRHVAGCEPNDPELAAEVEQWVEDGDASWLFSFEGICNAVDLVPEYVRRGLHACRDRARGAKREALPAATPAESAPVPERAKAS